MKRPIDWAILILLVIGTILIVRHDGSSWHTNRGTVFGTTYTITYYHSSDVQPLIEARYAEVDRSLSPFNPQSVITHINNGSSTLTDSLFRIVYRKAEEIYRLSNGAFDITCAPLVNAWGFGFRDAAAITPALIDSLLTFVGMEKTRLEGNNIVRDDSRTMFDCSAIAKGFGTDHVASLLDSLGITNYMVETGGEVVVRGHNPKGNAWRIGINRPDEASTNAIDTILTLSDCALATSGNYRNFYYRDGIRYAHTVDPREGNPVQHSVLSATVIAPTCMEADALATTFMVVGADTADMILASRPELRACLICDTDSGMSIVRLGNWP